MHWVLCLCCVKGFGNSFELSLILGVNGSGYREFFDSGLPALSFFWVCGSGDEISAGKKIVFTERGKLTVNRDIYVIKKQEKESFFSTCPS